MKKNQCRNRINNAKGKAKEGVMQAAGIRQPERPGKLRITSAKMEAAYTELTNDYRKTE